MISTDPDPSIDSIVFIFMYGRILAAKNILILQNCLRGEKRKQKVRE